MMDKDFAAGVHSNNQLWDAIHHHREVFTRMNGVDYRPDIRRRICLIPPRAIIEDWQKDYETMRDAMIYGDSLPFDELILRMELLQNRFRNSGV